MTRPKFLTELEQRKDDLRFIKVVACIAVVMYGVLGLIYWGIKR
jgi:hypothetical protein